MGRKYKLMAMVWGVLERLIPEELNKAAQDYKDLFAVYSLKKKQAKTVLNLGSLVSHVIPACTT